MSFWDAAQFGANSFNIKPPDQTYFDALRESGATWIRLTFSKWKGAGRDFLIGDADGYDTIPKSDLAILIETLDRAHEAGLGVVVVPLSLPGARWSQQNEGKFDDRLWSDNNYWAQAARFWQDLARALSGHPAIAAYNILNEPAPERTQKVTENGTVDELEAFHSAQVGTARDLPAFYEAVIGAIREVDPVTPIMVEGGHFANPRNLASWPKPLADDRVLYAFHMYEPYQATSAPNRRREDPLRYPGVVGDYGGTETTWDAELVRDHIGTAFEWAEENGLAPTRIVGAEFGCIRTWADCGEYLSDVMGAINERGGHWAYYTFRPDEWEGMDYEIPSSVPPGRYYWLMEKGRAADIPRNGDLFHLIQENMDN